ncbi:CpsD/CapB family tyrosine-protein kinase [Sphingomonas phyllosphaerae]|uniref:CpsD/CapB family tyrosine-protein kinase n=1 Tax=Sphingomonas phyllosphaerae TaxID=257003 RepID=UPI00241350AB|nr:CpsD/CapB family tyrosine-protein kinase [Sphingomonas phyllosphaerae]
MTDMLKAIPMTKPEIAPFAGETFPEFDRSAEFAWSTAEAKQRGIYGFDSRDVRSRPFNMLRSRLLKLQRHKGWRLFGIVSATPAVGKSFCATNLAAALSRTPGLDTYLVDLDLRRGSIAYNFGIPVERGMRDYLEGDVDSLAAFACHPQGERLVILPTDRAPAHSAELLASSRMERTIASMRAVTAPSIFLCDLPPVFANDDATIVTTKLDAFIMVVEEGRTTKKQVKDALHVLDQAPCAGVVLNRFDGGLLADSYGYGYGAGYADYYK